MLYRPEAFEPLTETPWDARGALDAIRRIVEDVDAASDRDALWPANEWDGWQAATQLKSDPKVADIPIIALTAFAMRGDEEKAREAGCDGYLSKPCRPQTIREVVRRYLRPD